MPASEFFEPVRRREIEQTIVEVLNREPYFLSTATHASPRAAGDALQSILSERLQDILGSSVIEYSSGFARRAMADIAFGDAQGNAYVVDVKTHRLGTAFNMPNLTSVERLTRFYENDLNFFVLLLLKYTVTPGRVVVEDVTFAPIEFLSWQCLTVGALGWGQIQIANASRVAIDESKPRQEWMLELCDRMLAFYPKEVEKITRRISYFEAAQARWRDRRSHDRS